VCDPVEDDQYGYQIGGILVVDFVTPNWFSHQHAQGNIDFQGHTNAAFEILTAATRKRSLSSSSPLSASKLAVERALVIARLSESPMNLCGSSFEKPQGASFVSAFEVATLPAIAVTM